MGLSGLFPGGEKLVEKAHHNGALHFAAKPRIYRDGLAQFVLFCGWLFALRILHGLHCRLSSVLGGLLGCFDHDDGFNGFRHGGQHEFLATETGGLCATPIDLINYGP